MVGVGWVRTRHRFRAVDDERVHSLAGATSTRRDGRVVDGGGLENRCTGRVPGVRIPLPPPNSRGNRSCRRESLRASNNTLRSLLFGSNRLSAHRATRVEWRNWGFGYCYVINPRTHRGSRVISSRQSWELLITFSLYPDPLFQGALRLALFTVLPAGFVGYIPADGAGPFPFGCRSACGWCTWIGYMGLAITVFEYGLRRYASASRFTTFG